MIIQVAAVVIVGFVLVGLAFLTYDLGRERGFHDGYSCGLRDGGQMQRDMWGWLDEEDT